MTMKFGGKVRDLHATLKFLGVKGKYRKISKEHWQYRAFSGAILNFYPFTGTIYFQGDEEAKCVLENELANFASDDIFRNLESRWYLK